MPKCKLNQKSLYNYVLMSNHKYIYSVVIICHAGIMSAYSQNECYLKEPFMFLRNSLGRSLIKIERIKEETRQI